MGQLGPADRLAHYRPGRLFCIRSEAQPRSGCARRKSDTMSLLATKSLERIMSESESGEHQLKRSLTATSLIALGIGAIIGAGLFSLTGLAAAQNAGPAIVLSMVVAAIGCAFAGLCYS